MIELSLDGRELRSSIVAERARFARLYLLRWRDLAVEIHVNESRTMIDLPPPTDPVAQLRGDATLHLCPGHFAEKWRDHDLFTADQLRAYALAERAAERERCALLATDMDYSPDGAIARAIRGQP